MPKLKQKQLNYLLFPTVLLIWGLLAYRFLGSPEQEKTILHQAQTEWLDTSQMVIDTYALNLDFHDPFAPTAAPQQTGSTEYNGHDGAYHQTPAYMEGVSKRVGPKVSRGQVRVLPWHNLQFSGTVGGSNPGRQTAILVIDQVSHVLAVGDSIMGIQLLSIHENSIKVQHKDSAWLLKRR